MKPHRARIIAMQAVYTLEFYSGEDVLGKEPGWIDYPLPDDEIRFIRKIIDGVIENQQEIDDFIRKFSKNWNFERISPVNKAILRISIYQLQKMTDEIPYKVIMDESIRIARKYSDLDSVRYINGVLDSVWKQIENEQ